MALSIIGSEANYQTELKAALASGFDSEASWINGGSWYIYGDPTEMMKAAQGM